MIEHIELDLLDSNPRNVRRTYLKLKELASSIERLGLLQNLVVVETPEGRFTVKSGERRLRALRMLRDEGKWNAHVPCLVIRAEIGDVVNIAENIAREGVPIWHEGHRLSELIQAGYLQRELALAIGKSREYVSYAVSLADGLHPETVAKLDKMQPGIVNARMLRTLATLKTGHHEPDKVRQLSMLDSLLKFKPKRESKEYRTKKWIAGRVDLLRALAEDYPYETRRVIEAVVKFIQSDQVSLNL